MKVRDSGMPAEEAWEKFFRPDAVLDRLNLLPGASNIVEFGCGYGTFTVAAATRTAGTVFAFDIDTEMVGRTRRRSAEARLANVIVEQRDFLEAGTGLADSFAEYVMLFNLLHAERPGDLLAEAYRILEPGGRVGVMHWNYDERTPRGPALEIRPRPEQCQLWIAAARFSVLPPGIIDLPPFHYGMVGQK